MSQTLFLISLLLITLIRLFLAVPLIIAKNFIPGLNKRFLFERRNLLSPESRSFKSINKSANILFHVSSEGELEQVRPLIEEALKKSLLVELVYTSESVENKCLKLFYENKNQLRILRLPIASFSPISFLYFQSIWSWATASNIVLCRYDFYPELLLFKIFKKRMILISGISKNINWHKLASMKLFDYIVAANSFERENLLKYFPQKEIDWFDFRVPRIFQRKNNPPDLFLQDIHLNKLDKQKNLIIGSMWESDLEIFKNSEFVEVIKNHKLNILIAPHKLNEDFVSELKKQLELILTDLKINIFDGLSETVDADVYIMTIPGVLCELYAYSNVAYIGGGFEKSIHSVLEPYIMGSKVIVGPKIHRSTEFDFVKGLSSEEISVLKDGKSFYTNFKLLNEELAQDQVRLKIKEDLEASSEAVIKRIFSTHAK